MPPERRRRPAPPNPLAFNALLTTDAGQTIAATAPVPTHWITGLNPATEAAPPTTVELSNNRVVLERLTLASLRSAQAEGRYQVGICRVNNGSEDETANYLVSYTGYWGPRGLAREFSLTNVFSLCVDRIGCDRYCTYAEILEPNKRPPLPDGKACLITDFLSKTVLEIVRLAPKNPIVRAIVLSCIKQPLPDDADTFDKIENWVEMNIKRDISLPDPNGAVATATIPVTVRRTVTGTAKYKGDVATTGGVAIPEAKIREWVDEALQTNNGIQFVHDRATRHIIELAKNIPHTPRPGSGSERYSEWVPVSVSEPDVNWRGSDMTGQLDTIIATRFSDAYTTLVNRR